METLPKRMVSSRDPCSSSSSIPSFPYAELSEPPPLPLIHSVQPRTEYKPANRNDPTNRNYRMRKRPPAQVYYCVQCNKHIKYPSKITEHIRKHTGEKPHVCVVCNQSFSQAHTLKNHMLTHVHEKPFKCSFCTAEFLNVCDKNEHESQHMHHANHSETMDDNCAPPFIQVAHHSNPEEPLEEEGEPLCGIYECPLACGFQSFEEAVVVDHIAMEHERYEAVCWEEDNAENETSEEPREVVEPTEVDGFTEEPEPTMYEFFDERFVPRVASEAIIDPSDEVDPTVDVPCSSSSVEYERHLGVDELGEIMYEGDEHVSKEIIIPRESHMKQVISKHMYGDMIIDDIEGDVGIGNVEEDEEQERVRVILNPNPPKRGTKSVRDHHETAAALTEMVVDAATLELAAPTRHLKQGFPVPARKKKGKKAVNLDWIIDAVAKGVDVNEASPHHRKKPTLHKCEFCGKVDKYPSKIRAHMRTHTGEKPFKCDICGMTFSQRTPMRLHLRRHFDQKPYECDVDGCKERFVSGAILKMHVEKKHLNKKKYVCIRGCGRVFSSAFNQRHHEKKCSQNAYLTWVEDNESGEETGGEYPEDDEEYEMMDMSNSEPDPVVEHYGEEPVFLHQ